MGQFLAIGLQLELAVKKTDVTKCLNDNTLEDVFKQIEEKCNLKNVFDREESDNYYVYHVKKEVLDKELIPFLEKFYSIRYSADYDSDSKEALNALKALDNTADRLNLLHDRCFQTYQDGENFGYCQIGKWPCDKIRFSCNNAILSLDGKIIMECYGSVFDFFRRCIIAQLAEFKLAQALTVWIDG